MKMLKFCGDVILPCAEPVLKVIVALFLIVWGQLNHDAFIFLPQEVNIWNTKHPIHLPECCLRHSVKDVFKINVNLMNSLALSSSFLLDEVHFLHLIADAASLPASTLPWF